MKKLYTLFQQRIDPSQMHTFNRLAFYHMGQWTVLLCLLLSSILPGQAQIYYIENDNLASTRNDQLWKINVDGSGQARVAINFADSPGVIAIDRVANKAYVAEGRLTVTPKIISVDLSNGSSTTLTSISGQSGCQGIALDLINQYIYYATGDGVPTTTNDQIRRVRYNGTGDELIVTNYVNAAGPISIDLANNRLFAIDSRPSTPKIVSINLSTSAVSTVLTSTSVITGLSFDSRVGKLYYMLSDGQVTTSVDELHRIDPNTLVDELVLGNFAANVPGNLALDKANNLMIVADVRGTAPEILKVNLANATASSVASLSANFALVGVAVFPTCATFTTALTPSWGAGPPSSTLTCAQTSLTLTATGGVSYQFARTGGGGIVSQSTSGSAIINASGTYSVTVTDAEGCTATSTTTISSNTTPPSATITTVSNLTTIDCNTTVLTLSASGGVSYRWDNGLTTATRNVNAANTYSVTVTGANGCTTVATKTISQNTTPPPVSLTASDVCAGQSVTLTATSGIGNYTFVGGSGVIGSGSTNTTTVSGLSAGPQSFTVLVRSSVNSCTNTAVASASVTALPTPTLVVSGSLNCTQTSVTLTATGGSSYTFAGPSGGIVSQDQTNGTAVVGAGGTYTVTAANALGCRASTTVAVSSGANFPSISLPSSSTGTTGIAIPGGLIFTASGGDGTYTFALSTLPPGLSVGLSSATQRIIDGAPTQAGVFPISLTVTDGAGCSAVSAPYTFSVSCPSLSLTTPSYSTALTGIALPSPLAWQASGGNSPYTFTFSSFPPGLTTNNVFTDHYDLSGTPTQTGTFPISVTVTDTYGCSVVNTSYSLTTACPTLALSTTTNIAACGGTGSIAFTTTLPNGTYSLSYVGVGSPRSVAISGGAFSLTGLSAGSYSSFSIHYGNAACLPTVSTTVVLTNPASPTVSITPTSGTLTCANPSLTLTASSSGTGLLWSTGVTTNTIVVTTVNVYSVTATAANNCTASATTTISSNTTTPAPTLTSNFSGSITCLQTSLTLTATGGNSYTFAGPGIASQNASAGTAVVNASGTYSVTVANTVNGCSSTTSIVIGQSVNLPIASLVVSGTLTCTQTSVTLTASGANSYAFSGPGVVSQNASAGTAVVNASGLYSVTVTNTATGCSSVTTTTVQSNTGVPTPGLVVSGTLTCARTAVTLTASGGVSYTFSGVGVVASVGNSATVNQASTFTVIATGPNGCTALATTTVQSNTSAPTPTVSAGPSSTLTCSQSSLTLTATGGNTYAFSGPGIVSQNTAAGTAVLNASGLYSVTVTNTATGCFSTTTITISFQNTGLPALSLTSSTSALSCGRPTAQLTASTGFASYRFAGPGLNQTGPANSAVVSLSGVFSVTGTVGVCSATASVNLIGVPGNVPNALLLGSGSLSCQTPTLTLTASGGSLYTFSGPGVVSQTNGRETIIVGNYIINRTPIPTVGTAVVNQPGTYTVVVRGPDGCTATASFVVSGTFCQ